MQARLKLLTAMMILSVSVLMPTGNISAAGAEAMNATNQFRSSAYQAVQVVNIEQSARKVIPNYVRWIHNGLHPSVRVDVLDVKLINVEEQGVVPDFKIELELVQRGPEKLIQTLQHDAFNPSSDKELTVSHNFTHTVSNASTLTKSITHSHKAGAKATFKVKTSFFGNEAEVGGELSYEYTNSNQSGTSDAKTVTFSTNSSASAKLPPMSKGTLISHVYASPAVYKIKSQSYFTGDVQFSYILSNDAPGAVRTLTVPIHDLFFRGDESNEVAYKDNLWAGAVWDDMGRPTKALIFEGLSFLTLDEQYRTETCLKDI
ncbi:MAG: hypothetical protein E6230_26275 [Paenibacillus dendritiformis]|uniref:hypothetical protein n=1 Tax=Paenibacillus dendritiformis TaxID=130049 RepID=UPI00143D51E9|nr:hypothetical protein [Paenibacillus dendritiformis]MDU5145683.1 hypothetical protein [Paenibacillus dendritiformis]NKI21572.1 hypothetical protein [Paenibacillus dendritiformis]NRF96405.1 hypothetical protein [Paenibacillus dendritiformis]GIO73985.1 hypothetical protein J27TS7_34990 [Paenibacillus dendritiformis]